MFDVYGWGIEDPRIGDALNRVPRESFIPDPYKDQACGNHPVTIGWGQTISQPYIVAYMTDLLRICPEDRILEIGTGSGYQTAVLAELAPAVFSVEIIPQLHERAKAVLNRLGYGGVILRLGNGHAGWPEEAPFDKIMVTAAAGAIPPALVEQLAPGGTMVIPVGPRFDVQYLYRIEKDEDGTVRKTRDIPVRFVPLTYRRRSSE